ncbi:MAG: hypothetical protein IJ055_02055 [Oscillospiraceae bacterium]|nr:hypothetical protein [Oscillospiraceae bacterium]
MNAKILTSLAALGSCAAMLAGTFPVSAAYAGPEEIALNLRPMTEDTQIHSADDSRMLVGHDAAQEGALLHFAVYIEADYADLAYISMKLGSDSEYLTFSEEGYQNPTLRTGETRTYTLPDGTSFTTDFQPYCLGKLNSQGDYLPDSLGVSATFKPDTLSINWNYSYSDTDALSPQFFGGISDYYSLVEFNVQLAPGTPPGEYHLSFIPAEPGITGQMVQRTYISSDDSVGKETNLVRTIPQMKDVTVVVLPEYEILDRTQIWRMHFTDEEGTLTQSDFPETIRIARPSADGSYEMLDVPFSSLGIEVPGTTPAELGKTLTGIRTLGALTYEGSPVYDTDYRESMLVQMAGVKGDVNFDGKCNANDASQALFYAAKVGAKQKNVRLADGTPEKETLAYFLADVDGASRTRGADGSAINAKDASYMLVYAARNGAGLDPRWEDIIG